MKWVDGVAHFFQQITIDIVQDKLEMVSYLITCKTTVSMYCLGSKWQNNIKAGWYLDKFC